MAGTKISALGSLSVLADGTIIPVVDTGTNYKLAATAIRDYVLSGLVTATNFAATSNGLGTSFKLGDDAWIGDVNLSNGFRVTGVQDATQGYIVFGNANNTVYIGRSGTGPITATGNFAVTGTTTLATSLTGLLKSTSGVVSAASAGTDYVSPSGLTSTLSSYVTSTSLTSTLNSYVTSTTLSGYNYITTGSLSVGTPNTASGTGAISYSAGVFKYTPPDLSGYATTSSLSSYLTTSSASSTYAPIANPTLTGTTTVSLFKGTQITEVFSSVTPTVSSNIASFDCSTGQIFNVTMTNFGANFTANLTNLGLATNYVTTITLVLNQGATAYIPTAMTVAGAGTVTFVWQGGSQPTGTANKKDAVALNILCTASNTYTVYAQLVSFG